MIRRARAQVFHRRGDHRRALVLYREATSIYDGLGYDREAARVRKTALDCLMYVGDVEAAEADVSEAEMGGPAEGLLLFAKAHAAEARGDTAEATKLFKSARRLDPSLKKL